MKHVEILNSDTERCKGNTRDNKPCAYRNKCLRFLAYDTEYNTPHQAGGDANPNQMVWVGDKNMHSGDDNCFMYLTW